MLRFEPRHGAEDFKSFFTGPEGWGSARQSRAGQMQTNEIFLAEGRLVLRELNLQVPGRPTTVHAEIGRRARKISFDADERGVRLSFAEPATVTTGELLQVRVAY